MDSKVWIINDDNKITSYSARDIQDIPRDLRNLIVAGPFTQKEFLSRLQSDPNPNQFWIVLNDNKFSYIEGDIVTIQSKRPRVILKAGPCDSKQEALEVINILRFAEGEHNVSLLWIIFYTGRNEYEIFYGTKEHLNLKLKECNNMEYRGPCTLADIKSYIKEDFTGSRAIGYTTDKFLVTITRTYEGYTFEDLKDFIGVANQQDDGDHYEILCGPFIHKQAIELMRK